MSEIELGPKTLAVLTRLCAAIENMGGSRAAAPPTAAAPASRPAAAVDPTNGLLFPNFGKSKNTPVFGATENDLRFYAKAEIRSIQDPTKARWVAKARDRLSLYNAELRRQGFQPVLEDTREMTDPTPPPAGTYQGGGNDEPPEDGRTSDDDIPFAFVERRLDRP
jgi:hypothetical protein